MTTIPPFTADGMLPAGDYEVSFDELRQSILVRGPADGSISPSWDRDWRLWLVAQLEVLAKQLRMIGITDIFADGSFVEDKDHPNDIDGYFVCDDVRALASGDLARRLNLLDPHKI